MFDYLYEWIQNLAFYMVLVTAFLHMLPGSAYKKYIQFFTGLILILMMISPIFKIFGMEHKITEIYQDNDFAQEIEEMQENVIKVEEIVIGH